MDKNKIRKQIIETEKMIESARRKRNAITIAVFALVFFLIFYLVDKPAGVYEILGVAAVSIVVSAFHFFVNSIVFVTLFQRSETERKIIEEMQKQLDNTTL